MAGGIPVARRRQMAILQVALYLVVGGISFCVDIGGFVFLRYFQLAVLPASAASFVTATLVNYLLCRAFVFRSGRFSRREEASRLFVIAVVGLGLNSAAVWLLAGVLGANPTLAKVLAVFPVFAWNYLGRRSMVFASGPSAAMALLSERLRVKP
jgi:putative flippase GtrA